MSETTEKPEVPEMLAHLEDAIFEGLPEDEARDWPLRFWRVVQPGADLSRVGPAVLYRIVERRRDALSDLEIEDALRAEVSAAMDQALDVLAEWRDTGEVDVDAASAAAESAWSAAESAGSAARSAARYAVRSARSARSAIWSVWSARSAAWAAARDAKDARDAWAASAAAEKDEYRWIADVLIEEIEAAPVMEATDVRP